MHWIDERLAQDKEIEDRKIQIRTEAVKIYDALLSYLEADINHANTTERFQVLKLIVNGSRPLRDVIIKRPTPQIQKEIHFRLSPDMHTISVSGEVNMKFHVDICKNGAVCLKDDSGKEVGQLGDAAKAILDPFLFPHLQPKK